MRYAFLKVENVPTARGILEAKNVPAAGPHFAEHLPLAAVGQQSRVVAVFAE